ncbi:MAG: Fic family protein [Phenylobacterium sp.]|jgi:Fic family protein
MTNPIQRLPLPNIEELESRQVLKKTANAHRYLAELKGVAASIPNEIILINTLTLQEAKHSSEIENIITTHDELFKTQLLSETVKNPAAKEVGN